MRAIILAAGMGTRLRPITLTTPKSLIEINGETLIERQIRFLKEKSINEIVVVTGYLAEKFDFLIEKYGVTLVHNENFDVYNNFYTMYLVRDYLADSYVIDADNYLVENFIDSNIQQSTYFSAFKKGFTDEWLLECESDNKVKSIVVTSGEGTIMSGVSFWDKETGEYLSRVIEDYFSDGNFKNLYWDNLVMDNLDKISVYLKSIPSESIFEIDNLSDLEKLKTYLSV
ncbi:NTP transferase domain-containing protein [Streptococcus sp. A27]|uniref:NTP transferase domain-containing protein n=1 Tax=unclassified Streptococcus TaxID=2608887 RepID=UPI00374DA44E